MRSKLLQKLSREESRLATEGARYETVTAATSRASRSDRESCPGQPSRASHPGGGFRGSRLHQAAFQPTPNEDVKRLAASYNQKAGLKPPTWSGYAPVDEEKAKKLADAYEALEHRPNDPAVKRSYDALVRQVKAQWDHAKAAGYVLEPWNREGQPYDSSDDMMNDVRQNKHLWYFTGGDMPADHPLAKEDSESGETYNNMFRGIHDLYGHAKGGYQFGPRGEHNAWLAHCEMFDEEAQPAMTTESAAQNSTVNYSKRLRDKNGNIPKKGEPGYVPPSERPFAEQKAGLSWYPE